MSEADAADERERAARIARGILVVREGHGRQLLEHRQRRRHALRDRRLGGAVFAAVAAALARRVASCGSRPREAEADGAKASPSGSAEQEP